MKKLLSRIAWNLSWAFLVRWARGKRDIQFLHKQSKFWSNVGIRLDPDSIPF